MSEKITKSLFGVLPDGREVFNYTFEDEKSQRAVISEYACAILETSVLAADGKFYDVSLGYDTLEEYVNDKLNFGATIGRYANRIARGKFTINGVTYNLPRNDGINTLHGGIGFRKKLFSSEMHDDYVLFSLESPDLDEGFPGNFRLDVKVSFKNGALLMNYDCVCDKDTPVNITNHNFFNLNGHGRGSILNHSVSINAEKYCKAKRDLIALAPSVSVENTPFDFRKAKKIIDGLLSYSPEIINAKGGFDHCFEIKNHKEPAAIATGDLTGIKLKVSCSENMPALQFYTGNGLGNVNGKNGAVYNSFDGFAIECQQFPNAVNEPLFPNAILKAGKHASYFIEFKFEA